MILSNIKYIISPKYVLPQRSLYLCLQRFIGTSSKSTSSSATVDEITVPHSSGKRTRKSTNWKSYGFDYIDQRKDIFWMHATSFGIVFGLFYTSIFIIYYYPDVDDMDWVYREAYLELRRREVLGLPLVDKNYVDPATVVLPPDETLGDHEIII